MAEASSSSANIFKNKPSSSVAADWTWVVWFGAGPDDAGDVLRMKAERCQMVYCGKLRRSSADIGLQNSSLC